MSNITSKFGSEPQASQFLPVIDAISDFTTTGFGAVYRPNFLETTDFSDAAENLASVSDNTFEADGNNYFVGQCIRLGANDGNNYVVETVGGTTGTDTITLDRNIEESDGDDIFISQYYSLVDILDVREKTTAQKRALGDGYYPCTYYIYVIQKSGGTQGQLDVIFANEKEITDFQLSVFDDIALFPIKKIVRNDNNTATDLYICLAF